MTAQEPQTAARYSLTSDSRALHDSTRGHDTESGRRCYLEGCGLLDRLAWIERRAAADEARGLAILTGMLPHGTSAEAMRHAVDTVRREAAAAAEARIAALTGDVRALKYRDPVTEAHFTWNAAIDDVLRVLGRLAATTPAAPPALDVERLAEAVRLWYVKVGRNPRTGSYDQPQAAWLAAEYARLAAQEAEG